MESTISIEKKKTEYKTLHTMVFKDKRLSYKARGIMSYLLSMPPNWKCNVTDVVRKSDKDGRESVRSGMKELCDLGYAELKNGYVDKEGKLHGKHYVVTDTPKKNK